MFKVMAFISRKPGTSPEEFRHYYETFHTRVVGSVTPSMKAYRRNYLNFAEAFKRSEDQIDFDVVTEMEFEDRAECERWFAAFRIPRAAERVAEDEEKFLDRATVRSALSRWKRPIIPLRRSRRDSDGEPADSPFKSDWKLNPPPHGWPR